MSKYPIIAGCVAALLVVGTALAQAPAAPGGGGRGGGAGAGGAGAGGAAAGAGRGGAAGAGGAARAPQPPPPPGPGGALVTDRGQSLKDGVQVQIPEYYDVFGVIDAVNAIPSNVVVKPKKPRRVLVYARAKGYVHSNIPLTAFAVKTLGEHTGAWQTDITYNQNDITAANLAKYDVLFMDNTTGAFLDDADAAATAARKQALLDFVRSGHGLAGTHATGDSYHGSSPAPAGAPAGTRGSPIGTWPEWNKLIGGYFKFHWVFPQEITVKVEDPKNPIVAAYGGKEFVIHDETYTFAQDSWSRKNVHVLTSIDYDKMSAEDKAKEQSPRTDHDFGLSWIRKEGNGRVFYNALGHNEHMIQQTPWLQELLAGIQYAAGDLAANDAPSAK